LSGARDDDDDDERLVSNSTFLADMAEIDREQSHKLRIQEQHLSNHDLLIFNRQKLFLFVIP
jgi:hypothetical protein